MRSGRERPGLINEILTNWWLLEWERKGNRGYVRGHEEGFEEFLRKRASDKLFRVSYNFINSKSPSIASQNPCHNFLGSWFIIETCLRQEDGIILHELEHFDIPQKLTHQVAVIGPSQDSQTTHWYAVTLRTYSLSPKRCDFWGNSRVFINRIKLLKA